ncbi:MAG: hypothetical protein AABX08_02535 [Nanoarchaeota archaeon]
MEVEFDFKEEQSKLFGPILRPVARVYFISGGVEYPEHVYVDSGADITLIPRSIGDILNFEIEKTDKITEIKGIGEQGVPIIIKKLKIKIGEKLIDTRIAWALIEEVPLLLGRMDVFNLFNITFKENKKTIFTD